MESNPAVPGGSLKSKPTWSNTSGCSATSAFFVFGVAGAPQRPRVNLGQSRKGRLIMYIGGGLLTLVIIVVVVVLLLRRV
jgi:hypothetical protein